MLETHPLFWKVLHFIPVKVLKDSTQWKQIFDLFSFHHSQKKYPENVDGESCQHMQRNNDKW